MTSERPLPHVALSAHAHNRMGLRRTDEVWLSERMSDQATRVLVRLDATAATVRARVRCWASPTRISSWRPTG